MILPAYTAPAERVQTPHTQQGWWYIGAEEPELPAIALWRYMNPQLDKPPWAYPQIQRRETVGHGALLYLAYALITG